jgi:GNAT superfamily N-acetyltransferase
MATFFRQLSPDHTPQLTDCLVRWHRGEGRFLDPRITGREVARTLADNQGWHVWLIEHKDTAVGYLAVNFRQGTASEVPRACIAGLYIVPDHRRQGLGRQARRLVDDLGRWLHLQVYHFETDGEAKHALALTRHGSVQRAWMDTSTWQESA